MQFPPRIELPQSTPPTNPAEPRLPTYEEVMGEDVAKLPSYSESFKTRYHPYRRPVILGDSIARLFNTIYDDERIVLEGVPPALPRRPTVYALIPGPLVVRPRRAYAAHVRRRLGVAILNEFIAGLRRAQVG